MRRGVGAQLGLAIAGVLLAIAGVAAGAGLGAGGVVELELEEALGVGGAWVPAGRLRARLPAEGWGKALAAVVERTPWDAAREAALAEVAESDGFVRYRVRQPSGDVMASARARCVSASGFQELFVLHPGAGSHLMGLEYTVPCAPAATGWAGGGGGGAPRGGPGGDPRGFQAEPGRRADPTPSPAAAAASGRPRCGRCEGGARSCVCEGAGRGPRGRGRLRGGPPGEGEGRPAVVAEELDVHALHRHAHPQCAHEGHG